MTLNGRNVTLAKIKKSFTEPTRKISTKINPYIMIIISGKMQAYDI